MKYLFDLFFLFIVISFSCCIQHEKWEDDRLCITPANDKVLEELIECSKKQVLRNVHPDIDTSIFFVSFNVFSQNDTDKVWVMGDFSNPIFMHDSAQWGMNNFLGYFKRRDTFCFFYKCIFSNQIKKESPRVSSFLLKDWRLRDSSENPEFFPKDISGTIQDPYIFEYMIDSIGNYTLLRKGYW